MTVEVSPPKRFGVFRIGGADIVFLFFALAILQRAGTGMVDDPGLGWQIRIPDAMVESGGFLHTDPFGGPTQGQPWITWGFLGSSLLRLGEAWGGLDGVAMVTALTIAFALRCLYRMMVTDGVPPVQAVVWTFLAALGVSSAWVARPNVFTLLFLLVTVRTCVQWHRDRIPKTRMLWLVPMFAVWANTHGGFAAGLVSIAIAGLVELGVAAWSRERRLVALARFRWLVILGAACGLATLINPYGPRLHLQALRLMSDTYFMNLNDDWLSPDFHAIGAFRLELLILLLPMLLAWSRHRPDALSLVLCVVWLHFALNGRRYCPLWVLVTVPMMGRLAAGLPLVERIGSWLSENRPDLVLTTPTPTARAPWLWTAVFAIALFGSTHYFGGYARHHSDNTPAPALNALLEQHRGETVFHSINWGGYLTWHGWDREPRFRTWIDDRNEFHGRARTEEWLNIQAGRPGWREAIDRHGIGLICVPTDSGLAERLAEVAGWERLHRDEAAVIYRRRQDGLSPGGTTP